MMIKKRVLFIKILGFLFLILGFVGVFTFFKNFIGPFEDFKLDSLAFERVPFLISVILFFAGIGVIRAKLWGQRLVLCASSLYLIHGLCLLHFIWTFHPWSAPTVFEKIKGIVVPSLIWFVLPIVIFTLFASPSLKKSFYGKGKERQNR